MCGEKLWKILCKPVGNFRILVLFPSFNTYETVDVFETSCEKPVASQPSLQVENKTWERFLLLKILLIFQRTKQLVCLWNFQVGNNNNRISKSSSRKRSTSFYSVFLLYFWKITKFLLMLSFLGGCKYFSSNRYHKWQSFPLIQWTSKKFYIIKLVFIERKKWE